MRHSDPVTAADVTAVDVTAAVTLVLDAFRDVPDDGWDGPAGSLAWTCWETVEHMADDLFAYAFQLGPADPSLDRYVPVVAEPRRAGGPANTIFAERGTGTAGLLEVLETCGAVLAAMVGAAPDDRRAYQVYGVSDPAGFAAMGVVEVLVHGHDLAGGLGRAWNPSGPLCARVLTRLFPDAPGDTDPWSALLWCAGRIELPGRPRRTGWRWDGTPRR